MTNASVTFAGDSAFATNAGRSSDQSTMSIFSPASSAVTARTREPSSPMHAPFALTPGCVARTAILVRWPASRATEAISTSPCAISGTSSANSLRTRPGWVRDSVIDGPFWPRVTLVTNARRRVPCA